MIIRLVMLADLKLSIIFYYHEQVDWCFQGRGKPTNRGVFKYSDKQNTNIASLFILLRKKIVINHQVVVLLNYPTVEAPLARRPLNY